MLIVIVIVRLQIIVIVMAAKDLASKVKTRTKDHNFVLEDNQGNIPAINIHNKVWVTVSYLPLL